MPSVYESVEEYINDFGWYVGPIHWIKDGGCSCRLGTSCRSAGKHPLLPNGVHGFSNDISVAKEWWQKWPEANVGLDLERSGIVMLGPDSPSFRERFEAEGLHDGSIIADSGGGEGHVHYYFQRPDGCPTTRINKPNEFDLQASGIAILPPSTHKSGRTRQWLTPPSKWPAPAPARIVEQLKSKSEDEDLGDLPPLPPMLEFTTLPVRLTDEGREWWTGSRVAFKTGTKDIDVSTTIHNMGRELAKAGATAEVIFAVLQDWSLRQGYAKFANRPIEYWRTSLKAVREVDEQELGGSAVKAEPLRLVAISAQDFARKAFPPQKWLVKGLFSYQAAVSMIVGESGSFKTWVAIELSRCVSLGIPFFGFEVTERKRVFYFNLEMPEALVQERAFGRYIDQEFRGDVYWVHSPSRPINLLNPDDFSEAIRLVREGDPGLIILDTLSKLHTGDAPESDNDKMTELILQARRLSEASNCLVILLHHTNKYNPEYPKPKVERIRGASAIRDNMLDVVFLTSKRGKGGEIYTEGELVKAWGGEIGASFKQRLVVEKDPETERISKAEWESFDEHGTSTEDPVWDEIIERLYLFFAQPPEGLGQDSISLTAFRGTPKSKSNPRGDLSYAALERLASVLKEMEDKGLVRVSQEGAKNRKIIYRGELW